MSELKQKERKFDSWESLNNLNKKNLNCYNK